MEKTLKITNVLADPTRYSIYEYITKKHKEVTVQEIADQFKIHPNVARLHLSKLEDVDMLKSENKKTGRGGRPSRIYRLSEEVIELNFPYRDYHLLAKIALEAMFSLGSVAEQALFETGKRYGEELMEHMLAKHSLVKEQISFDEKLEILKSTSSSLGFYPDIYVQEEEKKFYLEIFNCPFREIAMEHRQETCDMHYAFIKGLIGSLFDDFEIVTTQNLLDGCDSCAYHVNIEN
ncbi:helix-turn-helix transcriptional regulator [Fervidibacillus halotolerans]|uniref:Helix-turn-helix domain-containing protein n=1 Tax=Fervidibacillus halotolerans TaxID=2980027 RepID=A0A9E8LY58_9BACI|nr:helix-turn-helix domain-containing protein [Fervidibacillus halotolerans]WAA11450.1 helix-turn-helix domain-containing protein [Fervidibacillus halotolerans]